MTLEEGDVLLHRFSPTGFYSLGGAQSRSCAISKRAASARSPSPRKPLGDHHFQLDVGVGTSKNYWVTKGDLHPRARMVSRRASPRR